MESNPMISLPLFAPCRENYDPTSDWLDGLAPVHPFFDDADRIDALVHDIKQDLFVPILAGCRLLLERRPDHPSTSVLLKSLESNELLWRAILSVQKYGVIYLANRKEAKTFHLSYLADQDIAVQIEQFLQLDGNLCRAINYAVPRFINNERNQVIYPTKLVPPNAISSVGPRQFAVREKDFSNASEALLDDSSVIWDLHDFAHQTTASLSPTLYGTKYFSHLQHLPPRATALIRSPGMRTAEKGPMTSDGIVFSELLTALYTAEVENAKYHTYATLEFTLATAVANYLLGRRSLLHPSTGKMLQLDKAITIPQLAVLVQNKAYELTASEIEQRVFTRGGMEGDKRDILDNMNAGQRLETIANSRTWMYFEIRNTVKHRAHKAAYRQVAEVYHAQSQWLSEEDARLLAATIDALNYKDWETHGPPNLWALVGELQCFAQPKSVSTTKDTAPIAMESTGTNSDTAVSYLTSTLAQGLTV